MLRPAFWVWLKRGGFNIEQTLKFLKAYERQLLEEGKSITTVGIYICALRTAKIMRQEIELFKLPSPYEKRNIR
jgi:hypothetical protein